MMSGENHFELLARLRQEELLAEARRRRLSTPNQRGARVFRLALPRIARWSR